MSKQIGKDVRISRILSAEKRSLIVPLDHGLPIGPIQGITNLRQTLTKILLAQPDGVLLTPGQVQVCRDLLLGREAPAILIRVDWTNLFRSETNSEAYASICKPIDALAYGAEAVVTYLFSGYEDSTVETDNITNVAKVARECDALGIPLVVEAMARGKLLKGHEHDPKEVCIPVRMAGEIGADLIKTDYTGDKDSFRQIVNASPVPVMIAGGPKMSTLSDILQTVHDSMEAGACGIFFGRNVFQASDPAKMVKALRAMIHDNASLNDAKLIAQQSP